MNSRLQSPLRYSTCYLKLRTGLANAVEHVLQLSIITAVFVFMRLGRLGRLGAVAMMEMVGSWEVAQLPVANMNLLESSLDRVNPPVTGQECVELCLEDISSFQILALNSMALGP